MAEDAIAVEEEAPHTAPAEWRRRGPVFDGLQKLTGASFWGHPLVLWSVIAVAGLVIYLIVTTPLSFKLQAYLAIGSLIAAFWVRRYEGHVITLMLVLFSMVSSGRYIYWRLTDTLGIGDPLVSTLDLAFTFGLIAAELYALVVLVIGFFQVLWPLQRKPTALPDDVETWPTIDIYIPTYNEPLEVVRPTVLAASDIDWPEDKIKVYILDDGGREEFAQFAQDVGVEYIARVGSEHAKAGNINHALELTHGELVTIFDADHIPTRSFLQVAVGGFLADPDLALVQTPHHFFSPDPFERNLGTFKKVPNEGELFYGLLQDGNDFWDATFFCGSCAILRRTALEQIDGIAVETVTEDAHTALKMHRLGWHSAYINIPQAAGLATESLSGHVGQRIRWARGMAQIFRVDNPFLGKGLNLGQRLCYANAMLHFFYGLPRFVFLTAPLAYLFLEAHIFQAWAALIAVYLVPHLVVSNVTNSRIQGPFRHSFWAETYETVLAWYIMRPTLLAVINPKLGRFNVTEKGGIVEEDYVDTDIARPYVILLALNMIGFLVGILRMFFWNSHELETVALNMTWAVYNCFMLGAAVAVARERKQVRRSTRVNAELNAFLRSPDRKLSTTTTIDISEGGVMLDWSNGAHSLEKGNEVMVAIMPEEKEVFLPATVVDVDGQRLRLEFQELNIEQRRHLVYVSFGRADAWLNWREDRDIDHPAKSAMEVMRYGWKGIISIFGMGGVALKNVQKEKSKDEEEHTKKTAGAVAAVLLAVSTMMVSNDLQALEVEKVFSQETEAQEQDLPSQSRAGTKSQDLKVSFKQLGVLEPIRLRGVDARFSVPFSVRTDQVISKASLNLNFAHSKALIYRLSQVNVLVNNELVESIKLSDTTADGATRKIPVDPRLFVDYNQISFQFIGHYTLDCEDDAHTSLWALISNKSTLEISSEPLDIANDLAILPAPFFDRRDTTKLDLPFSFASAPDAATLQSAGVLASWFGGLASYRGARFPALIDDLPEGNGVVFMTGGNAPSGLSVPAGQGARLAMVDNPRNSNAKLLLVIGNDGAALLNAVRALSLGKVALTGESAKIIEVVEPEARKPYDAPRWITTDEPAEFGSFADPGSLQTEGYEGPPVKINLATAPDLFTWESDGIPVHLIYRFTPPFKEGNSTLNVSINDTFVRGLEINADQIAPSKLGSDAGVEQEADIFLPGYELSGTSQINARFFFSRPPTDCRRLTQNMVGSISPKSTIDLSGFAHYTRLPDLAKFTNSGFPFTRLADLSETAFVLPAKPSSAAIESYLLIMGRMGRHTGYPAIRVQVKTGGDAAGLADKNIIVIGTANSQPLLTQWQDDMPLSFTGNEVRLRTLGLIDRVTSLLGDRDLSAAHSHAGKVVAESNGELGALVGFESPLQSDRSVVAVIAQQESRLPMVAALMQDPGDAQFIQGDLTLLNSGTVSYYRLGETYTVGSLPVLTSMHWYFSQQPLLLLLLALIGVLLLAIIMYRALRAAARKRTGEE